MISPKEFHSTLSASGVEFFTGVPDSLLKEFCSYVDAVMPPQAHVIAANEGSAVALAAGYYLGTGRIPLVYMQNSGLGNSVNPLLSLVDREVYSLPMVLLIGWRGEPGVRDEPQHLKQGRVMPALLDSMEIPWREIDGDPFSAANAASWAAETALKLSAPVALLVRKGAFEKAEESSKPIPLEGATMLREAAVEVISSSLQEGTVVISTTGMISRELYEVRLRQGQNSARDFLTVGSMGHASQIAMGIALSRPDVEVVCIDGDGSALMHMGGLATLGSSGLSNITHIVLNNGVHDSVGGQPTVANQVSLTDIARACNYVVPSKSVYSEDDLRRKLHDLYLKKGPKFMEVRVVPGSRKDLGRPAESPVRNRDIFLASLSKDLELGTPKATRT
jgi:phosphonopyruvate decarboxylase